LPSPTAIQNSNQQINSNVSNSSSLTCDESGLLNTNFSDDSFADPDFVCSSKNSTFSSFEKENTISQQETPLNQIKILNHVVIKNNTITSFPNNENTNSTSLKKFVPPALNEQINTYPTELSNDDFMSKTNIQPKTKLNKPKRIRAKDFCFYCETKVSNFGRHLKRIHDNELEVQQILSKPVNINQVLKDKVFPTMRPDEITKVVKMDKLICEFGVRYLKLHPQKHYINVTSRKMRELSSLLIEVRKIKPTIKSLLDTLKPEHFEVLVKATKNAASYDVVKERYDSPTYALNMGTTLKQCCDIALLNVMKINNSDITEVKRNLDSLNHLIVSCWKYKISAHAADDLNLKKWNKCTIVPLAKDLKKFREYLMKQSTETYKQLETKGTKEAFIKLQELVYCKILLLNRKRPGELQRLLLSAYVDMDSQPQNHYEEFDDVLTASEKILVKKFKRIVIRDEEDPEELNMIQQEEPEEMEEFEVKDDVHLSKKLDINKASTSKHKNKKRILIPWTVDQKTVVKNYFKLHIQNQIPPKKHECLNLIKNYSELLQNKNWLKIKGNEQLPKAQINSTLTSNRIDVGIQKQTHITQNKRFDCNYCKSKLFGNRDTNSNVLIKEREADINFRQGLCYPSKNWKPMFI
ncbi:hypothetical protein RN001_001303, partial [Aquatica leii]